MRAQIVGFELGFGDRLDNYLRHFDQVIEATAGDGITAAETKVASTILAAEM